jgi:hypothetical protein
MLAQEAGLRTPARRVFANIQLWIANFSARAAAAAWSSKLATGIPIPVALYDGSPKKVA